MGIERVLLIILDSVGIGALPDADEFGNEGASTLPHIAKAIGGINLPNLESLGLGNITEIEGVTKVDKPTGAFGRMAEASNGKDTTIGHWEIAGIISEEAFPTYPNGFPPEIIDLFEEKIGRGVLGNRPESGTVIIEELGKEHIKTGKPIVYTSADSVFQIAAHEEVIPVEELYEMCKVAREILTGEHAVGRVIARPFVGELGDFERTDRREDFSLEPPAKTILDYISESDKSVMAVGKIEDIFSHQGITDSIHSGNNQEAIQDIQKFLNKGDEGLIFANLVDFDQEYGHRNDPEGYAKALERFDSNLPKIIESLTDDILMITADHGCDPTYEGTDHTREYVPLLVYGSLIEDGVDLGTRKSFADLGATIVDLLEVNEIKDGTSFKNEILK
ncbi:phosphopentomutase [Selenihalanaerobacter shriftii]|uniref:Phosphopentomutase n=1 Tax=Selenihalanaerobacter shriftii TaxID=142842 RepID=A0A1T4M545_9FIRM|nr:phosphopentomutase [Selenihalanaerobacter shriftii]SJZ61997.1 phosphopentomutase [Selenihalanaerobacter shriftii]